MTKFQWLVLEALVLLLSNQKDVSPTLKKLIANWLEKMKDV